jgi:hypothetical protein
MESKNFSHPFVSINSGDPEKTSGNRDEEMAQLKVTLFHESLHNLGFLHKEDIEFP